MVLSVWTYHGIAIKKLHKREKLQVAGPHVRLNLLAARSLLEANKRRLSETYNTIHNTTYNTKYDESLALFRYLVLDEKPLMHPFAVTYSCDS